MPVRHRKMVSRAEVRRVVSLLKNTDMSMAEIAVAVGCTRNSVSKINKKYGIRLHTVHRGGLLA